MDSLSSSALPLETPPAQNPFSHLAAFAQQIRSLRPLLGQPVQAASNNMATPLSCTASGRGWATGKFNFGVGMKEVDIGPEGPQVGEAFCSLFWPGSESPSESVSSEFSLSGVEVVKREVKLIKNPNREIDEDEGPLCSIKFLQGGG